MRGQRVQRSGGGRRNPACTEQKVVRLLLKSSKQKVIDSQPEAVYTFLPELLEETPVPLHAEHVHYWLVMHTNTNFVSLVFVF